MAGIDLEILMKIKFLAERGTNCAEIGKLLSLPESNVCYHLGRLRSGAFDGRGTRLRRASAVAGATQRGSSGATNALATCKFWRASCLIAHGTGRSSVMAASQNRSAASAAQAHTSC